MKTRSHPDTWRSLRLRTKFARSVKKSCLGLLALAAVSGAHAQTFPTSGNQYIWKVGDGTYSDWASNYSFNNGSTSTAPNSFRDVIFGWDGTPSTATVSLDPAATGTTGRPRSLSVYTGNFTFDRNTSASQAWDQLWNFGNAGQSTPLVHFTGAAGSAYSFTNLVIGASGSSGNIWGGEDATITFDSNVTHTLSAAGTLTVGSTAGGGGNEFNVLAGQNITRGAITVNAGAGNKISVSGGGTLASSAATTIGAGAALVVEGEGSNFTKTGSADFTTSGDVVVSNQATINQSGNALVVNSGGSLTVDNATYAIERSVTSYNVATATVGGLLEVKNGGVLEVSVTTTATPGDQPLYSQFTVNGTGRVVVDGGSSFSTNNNLRLLQGAQFEVKGNSSASVGMYSTYYQQSGNHLAETPVVEAGSTFRFETLQLGNRDWMEGIGDGNPANVLSGGGSVQGLLIWGTGGTQIGNFNDNQVTDLVLATGTRLRLDGGDYNLHGGNLTIDAGATLEGNGTFRASVNGGGTINAGINEGASGEAGALTFTGGSIEPSNVVFDIYGTDLGTYDQIFTGGLNSASPISITLNLWGENFDFGSLDPEFTQFALFRSLEDGDIENSFGYTFDFGTSSAQLAEHGWAWDTSEFASTGMLGIQAVPEPSTVGLLGLGLAAALWKMRKRRVSVA